MFMYVSEEATARMSMITQLEAEDSFQSRKLFARYAVYDRKSAAL